MRSAASSLDHLVGAHEQRLPDREAEGFRRFEIDHQLEHGGLLDGKIAGLGTLENLVHVMGGTHVHRTQVWPIREQPSGARELAELEHPRQALLLTKRNDSPREE